MENPALSDLRELTLPLRRSLAGFEATDLFADITAGVHTLIAPIDEAFDPLPWRFDDLLANRALVEERFELFEYMVVPELCDADGPMQSFPTLQRERITIGRGQVVGPNGVARILASARCRGALLHAIDACVLPRTLLRGPLGV